MFKVQIIYSVLVFASLSLFQQSNLNIWDGTKGAFLVLGITAFLISVPNAMLSLYKNLSCDNDSKNIKRVRITFIIINYLTIGLFIITLCFAILSFVGVLISNVSVTTSYILLLVVPMWLSVRASIKNFLNRIEVDC